MVKTDVKFNFSALRYKAKQILGSEKALANELKVNVATLSDKLNSKSSFSAYEIYKICDILQIPADKIGTYFFCTEC